MSDALNKLALLTRTPVTLLADLETKMNALTGQEGVYEDIVRHNDRAAQEALAALGLSLKDAPKVVRDALLARLAELDRHLYEILEKPDLARAAQTCGKLLETVLKVFNPPPGTFLKREKALAMLEQFPPQNILEHFGYANVRELVDKEGFSSVMASLRFTQSQEWMHKFFEVAYSDLKHADFEERDVELLILDPKWLYVAEKLVAKKYHNVSHLKEFGIIFIIPIDINLPGRTLRMFTLLMHYLHEVPFYDALFRRHLTDPATFGTTFKSLLRGDVTDQPLPTTGKVTWRIVQRYLTKDNPNDPRLFEPHVNPESSHWHLAEADLGRVSRILGDAPGKLNLDSWTELDFVGELFSDPFTGQQELVSFDLIDLTMSLVEKDQRVFLYHQQESLWNKIFIEYMGREQLAELVEEHIIDGFIRL